MGRAGKVWIHRSLAIFFTALAVPACLWWKQSILFVILLSLATQISTELGAAEAADDRTLADQQDRIEAKLDRLLKQRGAGDDSPRTAGIRP